MNQAVESGFAFVEERGLIAKLSSEARANIERGLLPVRHLHWGSNMNMTEICQRGYGTAVTAPCIFSAGDQLGLAQIVSRIGLELDGQSGASLDRAKQTWLTDPAWQGIRQLIEDTFVERDFFQLYVAQTLAVNGVLLDLVYKHFDAAWKDGSITVGLLTGFESSWRADEAKWSDSVVKVVAAESEHNKALVSQWAKHWIDRAIEAAKPLSVALVGDESAAHAAGHAAFSKARSLGLSL
jgi:phenol hydroxylase P1 protein